MSFGSPDWIVLSFSICNALRMASYLPQIVAVARDRNGATAISLSCWTIWVGANATTGLYTWVNLSDIGLTAISAFNAACCVVVLVLAAYKRINSPPGTEVGYSQEDADEGVHQLFLKFELKLRSTVGMLSTIFAQQLQAIIAQKRRRDNIT
jgi:hypothetical protein